MLEPAWLCYYSSLAFAYSHQGKIKPGKMQKCCRTAGASRDPSGLIQEYNRAHCTVQLKNKFFVKWGLPFYCHYSVVVSALISSPSSKAFFRTILISVGKGTYESRYHPVFCEELGSSTAQLWRASKEGVKEHKWIFKKSMRQTKRWTVFFSSIVSL